MDDYLAAAKKKLEKVIPPIDSKDFKRMRNRIRSQLKKKENDFMLITRSLKIIVLGDWRTSDQRHRLNRVKDTLLKNGIYTQTIDDYYDMNKSGGLSQVQILETCCINHQLIVFLDGEGSGTITEQDYLADNYVFQGKTIFFIAERKFNTLKDNPSEYIRIFPTIITHSQADLLDKILVYARLRIYRLAEIIMRQSETGRGLRNPRYEPWRKRLIRLRGQHK